MHPPSHSALLPFHGVQVQVHKSPTEIDFSSHPQLVKSLCHFGLYYRESKTMRHEIDRKKKMHANDRTFSHCYMHMHTKYRILRAPITRSIGLLRQVTNFELKKFKLTLKLYLLTISYPCNEK